MPTTTSAHIDQILDTSENYDRDTVARIAWSVITGPTDEQAGAIVNDHGAERALKAVLSEGWTHHEGIPLDGLRERIAPAFTAEAVAYAVQTAANAGVTVLTPAHPHWPAGLNELGNKAPFVLWAKGDTSLLVHEHRIALTGTTKPTGLGEFATYTLTSGLVDQAYALVSPAAMGIDTALLSAALSGNGKVIAVLAGGIDRYFPLPNAHRLQRVAENGVIIGESPCGTTPTKWLFAARTRLVAAIAQATIIIEATTDSSALHVVGWARALNRPTGAVPGPIHSSESKGCHQLLRSGATCITSPIEAAELAAARALTPLEPTESAQILAAMSDRSPRREVDIAFRARSTPKAIARALDTLHAEGLVKPSERGWTKS